MQTLHKWMTLCTVAVLLLFGQVVFAAGAPPDVDALMVAQKGV